MLWFDVAMVGFSHRDGILVGPISHDNPRESLLTAIAELLTKHQPHNAPVWHSARTVQQVTHAEFHVEAVPGFELATPLG